jgi:Ca2+-binding EF-hand superfamily protein
MRRRIDRLTTLSAALALTLAGAVIAAPPAPAANAGHRRPMPELDINQDGVIDRAEATGHPRLAGKFERLDQNSDGKLDATERSRAHGKRKHRGHRDRVGHAVRLDTNGDGRISTIEAAQSRLAARFGAIDRNRDGYLVRSELHAATEQRRRESAAKRAQRFEAEFTAADANRDGKLSRAEVEAHLPRHAHAFTFLDEDRDGFLTRADLRPTPRR